MFPLAGIRNETGQSLAGIMSLGLIPVHSQVICLLYILHLLPRHHHHRPLLLLHLLQSVVSEATRSNTRYAGPILLLAGIKNLTAHFHATNFTNTLKTAPISPINSLDLQRKLTLILKLINKESVI
jgi:hypothetical protein